MVRFDEEENATTFPPSEIWPTPRPLAATSLTNVSDSIHYPYNPPGALAGWMYLNLHDYGTGTAAFATQNWVVISMRAGDRLSADLEAIALGNGCSPITPYTEAVGFGPPIGPAPNRP